MATPQPTTVDQSSCRCGRAFSTLGQRLSKLWGLVRRENLKAGEGDERWLRFFTLMAGEMAAIDRAAPVPGVPEEERLRREEIRDLDSALAAIRNLESYREAIHFADRHFTRHAAYYVIAYNEETKEGVVEPIRRPPRWC